MKTLLTSVFAITIIALLSLSVHAAPSVSVVFVLDESGSISSSNFNLETQGFQSALSALPLDGSIEVSVVGFASGSSTIVDKVELTAETLSTVDSALANNPKNGGGTVMSGAISTSAGILLGSSAPSKVICLATDGEPNNQSSTTQAANDAKNSGIFLSPVGIGLGSTGKTFLDSIASDPPIPNPSNFTDFATVVTNVCVGVTASALNLELTPNPVNFGVTQGSGQSQCSLQETVTLINRSNQSAQITNISIQGQDAADFQLVTALGQPFDTLTLPAIIPGLISMPIEVQLLPMSTPDDGTYDAAIVVSAVDDNGVSGDFFATMQAPISSDCLSVSIWDAQAAIGSIDENGVPSNLFDNGLTEADALAAIGDAWYERTGLVADGNARLLLTATTSLTDGTMRFEIIQPGQTEARLGSLDNSSNSGGSNAVDVDLSANANGEGQATAILRAGERFLGTPGEAEVNFEVRVCLLDDQGSCTPFVQSKQIRERRAPVILIHGLWADNSSWTDVPWTVDNSEAMKPQLEQANFRVAMFNYTNSEGPSTTMRPSNNGLFNAILRQCLEERYEGFACTRNDLVGHSMGGLVSRKYIKDNVKHKNKLNFQQGSVRRLLTLGTPHLGSGFASLLTFKNAEIGNCIENVLDVIRLIQVLELVGNKVAGAAKDLSINSTFLNSLNSKRQNVNTYGVIGDVGNNDLTQWDYATTRTGCDHAELFQGKNSDSVVSVVSAQGNLGDSNVRILKGAFHAGMGTNSEMVALTIEILNGSLTDFSLFAKNSIGDYLDGLAYQYSQIPKPKFENVTRILEKIGQQLLSIIGISSAHAQELPSVDLAVSNNTASPLESVVFTASITGSDVTTVVLTDGGQYQQADNAPPYEWTFDLSNTASGQRTFKVVAIIDGQVLESNAQTVIVKPDLSSLQSMRFEPGRTVILFPGMSNQLRLTGLFNDGFKRGLTQGAMETAYSENIVSGLTATAGDSPVISISANGLVTANELGSADVVATNNGKTAVQRVNVVAIEIDDSDGDGLTDAQEQAIGTNPFNPDSDGDNSIDSIEIGGSLTAPINSSNTATIDALNNSVIVIKDNSDQYVSFQASAGKLLNPYGTPLGDYPEKADALSEISMPRGLLSFTIEGLSAGESVDVILTFDALPVGSSRYLKYGLQLPSNLIAWYDFQDFEINGNQIVLHLTDNQLGDANPLSGVITASGGPGVLPQPPIANAGVDQTANAGSTIMLSAAASNDAESSTLSYQWVQTGGTKVVISDPSAVAPEISIPSTAVNGELLVFELTVTDDELLTHTDTIVITVEGVDEELVVPNITITMLEVPIGSDISLEQSVIIMRFQLASDSATLLNSIALEASGSGNDAIDIDIVRLHVDINNNGVIDADEPLIAEGNYEDDNGIITLSTFKPYALVEGDTEFIISYDF